MRFKNKKKLENSLQGPFSGFTLVEILLALSLFSLVLLGVYGSFWAGLRIQRRSSESGHVYRAIVWALQEISQELSQAVFYSAPDKISVFNGASDEIKFLFPSKDGLKQIRYFLTPQEQTHFYQTVIGTRTNQNLPVTIRYDQPRILYALCREERPFLAHPQGALETQTEVISLGVMENGLTFLYAYIVTHNDQATIVWKDRWDRDFIPAGVKVGIKFFDAQKPQGFEYIEKMIYIPAGFWGEDEV